MGTYILIIMMAASSPNATEYNMRHPVQTEVFSSEHTCIKAKTLVERNLRNNRMVVECIRQ